MKEGWGHGAETRGQVQLRTVKAEGPTKLRTAGLGWPGEPPGPPEAGRPVLYVCTSLTELADRESCS